MKKLMTAIAVAGLSAAVFGDVTSANVVGYAGSGLNNDGSKRTLITPQFASVGAGKAIKLKDLRPVSTASVSKNRITLSQLTDTGRTIDALDAKWNGAGSWTTNGIDASEMEIPEGTGLYVLNNVTGAAVSLQGAGEVNTTSDSVVLLNATGSKRTATGNPFPVAVKLKDIVPEAVIAGQSISKNRITISQMTSTGRTIDALDAKWNGAGQWTTNSVDASEMVIPAGQGLYVLCNVTTTPVNLRIKNPLVKDVE